MINKLKQDCCFIIKSNIKRCVANSEEEVKKVVARLKLLKCENIEVIKLW